MSLFPPGAWGVKIGFSTSRHNPISWLIRTLTRSKVSHTWLVVDDALLGRVVLEASEVGFRVWPFARFAQRNVIVAVVEPMQCDMRRGVQAVADLIGTPYDVEGLFGMALVVVGRWLHRKVKNPLHSTKASFCSEAVARALIASGHACAATLDPESATPQDIYEILSPP